MENSDLQRIRYIRVYCEEIAATIKRFGEDFDVFSGDTDYLKSVSMSILQIGELSIGLSDEFKDNTKEQMQWTAIRGMRNMYAHAYARMSKSKIWETATKDIPAVLEFCDGIIEEEKAKEAPVKAMSLSEKLEHCKKIASETSNDENAQNKKDKESR